MGVGLSFGLLVILSFKAGQEICRELALEGRAHEDDKMRAKRR
jgi:hypothetical protein